VTNDTKYKRYGFTLVEMLLSITIITILAGLSLPIYQGFQHRNDLASSTQTIAETLRRAETYARAVNADSQWGVNFQASTVTLFSGTSYAARNAALDETFALPANITLGYSGDIIFAKLTGFPSSPLTQTVSANGSTRTIAVNVKGMIDD
jgi:prepilin-type N-terminal cleavage/methylation domain-containing protein